MVALVIFSTSGLSTIIYREAGFIAQSSLYNTNTRTLRLVDPKQAACWPSSAAVIVMLQIPLSLYPLQVLFALSTTFLSFPSLHPLCLCSTTSSYLLFLHPYMIFSSPGGLHSKHAGLAAPACSLIAIVPQHFHLHALSQVTYLLPSQGPLTLWLLPMQAAHTHTSSLFPIMHWLGVRVPQNSLLAPMS